MFIRYVAVFVALTFSLNTYADSLNVFFESFKRELLLTKTSRHRELEENLSVRTFNAFDRMINPDAAATYNGKINQIKLDSLLLKKNGYSYSIKSVQEVLKSSTSGAVFVGTIFHELGHAEMDILIENKKSANDEALMYQYKNKIKEVFRRNFKGNTWTIFHEYFAYYRTDLVEGMLWDKGDIYRENGYNPQNGTCFLTKSLKKQLAEKISLAEFQNFYAFRPLKNYREGAAPRYVFVRGKDFDLSKLSVADQKIIQETNNLFWMYHMEEYGFPTTQKVLVERMNLRDPELVKFRTCREELYKQNI